MTTCVICHTQTTDHDRCVIDALYGSGDEPAHNNCASAYLRDATDELRRIVQDRRTAACAAGQHRYPGEWTKDPGDPYGDAGYWECGHGCGHVERHPGYGIGRQIAEMVAAGLLPAEEVEQ